MSNTTDQNADRKNSPPDLGIRLRIWPAAFIVLAYLAVAYGFSRLGSTNIQSFIELVIVPLAAALLLVIWWLAASRAPWLDRLAGLVLLILANVWVVFTQERNGAMLLAYAIPTMTTGMVALLVLTYRLRWSTQRWIIIIFLVACAGVFTAMRVDTIGGNLAPIASWRWTPTEAERSTALARPATQATAVLPAQAGPDDWPSFRGPARDSRVVGTTFSTDWRKPPRELWRRKVGPGWSSFIAVGDYVFTQEQSGEEELVTCYSAATGEPFWVNRIKGRFEDTMGLGPRATPTFDQGKLYTQGGAGALQCLDASTGNTIWKRDLAADAETKVPGYGFSSSPLVVGDLVIEFSGGGDGKNVVAYNHATGDVVWCAGHRGDAYTSPHLASIDGVSQVLMIGDFGLQSFVPETGAPLWEHLWKVKTNPRCVQPLIVDSNLVMLGSTGTTGSRLLRIQKQETSWNIKEEWTSKKFRPYFNDCVMHKGDAYGFDGDRLVCVDMKVGERRWEGQRYGGQLLLFPEMDTLLVLSEAGEVVLVRAIPEQFTEMARFKAINGKTWNHPTVAHGKLFVRNADEAACFELPIK